MQSCPVGKSLNKHSSQPMISPTGRDINVQMCRIVSADVTNSSEMFNATEFNKLRQVLETIDEIPDGWTKVTRFFVDGVVRHA